MAQSQQSLPFIKTENWLGVNSKDSNDDMLDGELQESSVNVWSNPQGALGMRPGYSSITSASIGTATAWCGMYYFENDTADTLVGAGSDGKIYKFESNAYTELQVVTGATGVDARYSFFQIGQTMLVLDGSTSMMKWTASGSLATAGGTLVTADWGLEWHRYAWLHSTADPRLIYRSEDQDDAESGYTFFLNFDRTPGDVVGAVTQGDDMLVGKEKGLFRVQFTGGSPAFQLYALPTKIGPVSHYSMREIPDDGRVLFLGKNNQVYMVLPNDQVIPVGDNIRKVIRDSVQNRLNLSIACINEYRDQYWLTITYNSGSTVHDRTLVMHYNRPYQDKRGKLQYPWFIYEMEDNPNAYAEVHVSVRS